MASCPTTLSKQPTEKIYFGMDFSARLGDSDTISSATVTSTQIDGASSDLDIEDPADINGQIVYFWISGGIDNSRYKVKVIIEVSTGAILEGDGMLVVKD